MQFNHRGIIKRILKDHFDGFWKMNEEAFPAQYRQDILEAVQKSLRWVQKIWDIFVMNVLLASDQQASNRSPHSVRFLTFQSKNFHEIFSDTTNVRGYYDLVMIFKITLNFFLLLLVLIKPGN